MTITFTKKETMKQKAQDKRIMVSSGCDDDDLDCNLFNELQKVSSKSKALKITTNEEDGSTTIDLNEDFVIDCYNVVAPFLVTCFTFCANTKTFFTSLFSSFGGELKALNQRWMKQPEKEDENKEEEAE